MEIEDFSFDQDHPMGDSATHPMAPLATRLGALPVAHSGASN